MQSQNDRRTLIRFIGWLFFINGLLFWLIGYQYLESILLSPTLFKNYVADLSSVSGKALLITFAVVNYLQYLLVLAFLPALILMLIAWLLPFKRVIWVLCIVVASILVITLYVDTVIYSMFKFHLNRTLINMAVNGQFFDLFDFSVHELYFFIGVVGLILVLEVVIAYLVWNKIISAQRCHVGQTIGIFWIGAFAFSYCTLLLSMAQGNNLFSQQTPNLPLYNQLMVHLIPVKNAENLLYEYSEAHYAQPLYSNSKLLYPLHPMNCKKPQSPPNIILIMIDSLRFDSVQEKYMPHLDKFSKTNWNFQNNLSGGNSTQPGLFTLFYSIPPNYWTAALEQKIPPVLLQLLVTYKYKTEVLWAGELHNPPFDKTIYLNLKDVNHNQTPGLDVGDNDRQLTQQAIQFLSKDHKHQPFFLNLFYDAAHGYCREQSYPKPFQPATEGCVRIGLTNDTDPLPYLNRYLNAVHFIDTELAKVLSSIDKQGYLQNSIVIITSDHGQEFNDNQQNYWEHASNFTNAQMQVPLIIHWPGKSARNIPYLTSNYDVVPTLLQGVFECENPIMDYSIGQNLLKPPIPVPFILAGSYINTGLIEPERLTTLHASGPISSTDKHAKPLPDAVPDEGLIQKALELMRRYYVRN